MSGNLLNPTMPGHGTELPDDADVRHALAGGAAPSVVAAAHPARSLPWAVLAEQALAAGEPVQAYAYARVGYHRGLDALRGAGWRGSGPVLWSHEPNRGFLRALDALGAAAGAIGEDVERRRCATFLDDCDPAAALEISRLRAGTA
jgi:hypothetical protein